MGSPAAPFVLFRNDFDSSSVLFDSPREIVTARDGEELRQAFDRLEQARADGLWSAGFVSYEAGFYFDEAFAERAGNKAMRTPLLCFGLFNEAKIADATYMADGDEAQFLSGLRADWNLETYAAKFAVLHGHLRAGNCYQANLTFPIRAEWRGDPLDAFRGLTARQPVRYGVCVSLCDPVLVSRSPELFFKVDRDGWIETHPMKGTAPRRADPAADAEEIRKLKEDTKTQAENRMIVDLLRNDISRISQVGTLDVPSLFEVETYPTLHQMISRVRAKLLPDTTIHNIFSALFPAARSPARRRLPRWRSSTIWRRRRAKPIAGRSAMSLRAARCDSMWPFARSRCLPTARRSSMSAAGSSSTRRRKPNMRKRC